MAKTKIALIQMKMSSDTQKNMSIAVRKISATVFNAPISPPILIIKNISKAGKPIKIRKNVFICLIQNYIIHVYLSNYE